MGFRCAEFICLGIGVGLLVLAAVFFGVGAWNVEDGREFDRDSSEEVCNIIQSFYRGGCNDDDDGWGSASEYFVNIRTTKCPNTLSRSTCTRSGWAYQAGWGVRCWVHDNCQDLRFEDPLGTHIGGWVLIALGVGAVIAGIILIVFACRRSKTNEDQVTVTEPYTNAQPAPVGAPTYAQPQQGAPVQGAPMQQPYPQQPQPQGYPQQPQPQGYPQQPQPQPQAYPQQQPYQQPGAPPMK